MLTFLKKKNPYEQAARHVYAGLLQQVRNPRFYSEYGVPDTMEGRFDLLLVHIFMMIQAYGNEERNARDFNQALFDVTFADMDQMLRETGIGDMGVPKRMRRLMQGFNGRMQAYAASLNNEAEFKKALERNLYASAAVPAAHIEKMKNYIQKSLDLIKKQAHFPSESEETRFADL